MWHVRGVFNAGRTVGKTGSTTQAPGHVWARKHSFGSFVYQHHPGLKNFQSEQTRDRNSMEEN